MTSSAEPATEPKISFDTDPSSYRHWRLDVQGPVAYLRLDVAEDGGLVPGYELKLNSYDLGVDIELHDAVQRLRFEHPEVRVVVLTSGKERVFCAGANIRMLATSPHSWKVNFCKFTNETRNGMEDASAHSGQTYLAALNGPASGERHRRRADRAGQAPHRRPDRLPARVRRPGPGRRRRHHHRHRARRGRAGQRG